MPIGVFDSGLGGLNVLTQLQKELPDQAFMYLGDRRNAPYSGRDPEDIFNLTCQGVEHLFSHGCELVLIACNTASATALHRMQTEWLPTGPRRVLGGFVPIIESLTQRDWGDNAAPTHTGLSNVALFATQSTIESGAFAREMKFRARDVDVYGNACDDLVDAVERGDLKAAEILVQIHVATMLAQIPYPQAVVLGCNHYAVLDELFRNALPDATPVVSAPELVARATKDYLGRHARFVEKGDVTFLTTTDSAEMGELAHQFLGQHLDWQAIKMDENHA